jgi:hypothetical protein
MSPAEHYLDIKISQQSDKITLIQLVFIIKILECFSMRDSKSISTFIKYRAQLDLEITGKLLNKEEKE